MAEFKRLRLAAGISQIAAARMIGVDGLKISAWERGRQKPAKAQYQAIADAYRCSIGDVEKAVAEAEEVIAYYNGRRRKGKNDDGASIPEQAHDAQ